MRAAVPDRNAYLHLPVCAALLTWVVTAGAWAEEGPGPEKLLLKDFHPQSVYRIPQTNVAKARYPVIDMHAHVYARTPERIAEWIRMMDETGVQKAIVLSTATGKEFDKVYALYAKYPERFEVWGTRARGCSTASPRPGACTSMTRVWTRCWRNARS
jgi:hypothetical protein